MKGVVLKFRRCILGWGGCFGISEVSSPLCDPDKWNRRRLRSYHWKQRDRRGYRELRKRDVSRGLAGMHPSRPTGHGV